MSGVDITDSGRTVQFAVRVVPRAGRTAAAGVRDGALVVRLAAAPVDDAANEALIGFVASLVGRPRRDVTIVSGHKSRNKRVTIDGVTAEQLRARLSDILPR